MPAPARGCTRTGVTPAGQSRGSRATGARVRGCAPTVCRRRFKGHFGRWFRGTVWGLSRRDVPPRRTAGAEWTALRSDAAGMGLGERGSLAERSRWRSGARALRLGRGGLGCRPHGLTSPIRPPSPAISAALAASEQWREHRRADGALPFERTESVRLTVSQPRRFSARGRANRAAAIPLSAIFF